MPSTRKKTKAKPAGTSHAVYQLKVTLLGVKPPVWRRLLAREDTRLDQLDVLIQGAMGWTNSHLHQFVAGDVYYSNPSFELDECEDESRVMLKDVLSKPGDRMRYEYDFGDGWQHDVVAEKISPAKVPFKHPVCLGGKRACPPEDCGGVWGYRELLEILADPKHEEHEERLEWLGGRFDPEAFDLDDINGWMKTLLY